MSKTDIINIENYNENNQQFNNLNTEDIFIRQKSEIEKIKLKNKSIKLKTTFDLSNQGDITNNSHRLHNNPTQINNKNENLNNSLQPISLLDYNNFECTTFDYNMDTERENLPKIDNIWIENSQIKAYKNGQKPIELKNLALRTKNEINYDKKGIELIIDFSLKCNSQFWIFSRSFVNKDINESIVFDNESVHNESNDVFNKYASVIKITYEDFKRCFINYGTFIEDKNKNILIYKTFFKRQLIEYKTSEKNYYDDDDSCDFNLVLLDTGSENIETKIKLNNSEKENLTKGNFYIPINKKARLLFCGVGESVEIKKLFINTFEKVDDDENFNNIFSNEKKTCNCCIIF